VNFSENNGSNPLKPRRMNPKCASETKEDESLSGVRMRKDDYESSTSRLSGH